MGAENDLVKIIVEDLSFGAERFAIPVVSNFQSTLDTSIFNKFKYSSRIIDNSGHLKSRSSPILFCSCNGKCKENCDCSSGIYTNYGTVEDMNQLICNKVRECNENCECALWCGNRVAQKGATYPVEIFARDLKCGWGVRCKVDIPYGTYIGEYTGELIDDEEASSRDTTFLFETRLGPETYSIDAKYSGNFTRFINHSCSPNIHVANVSWDIDEYELIHMCFYTNRDIYQNEELTIDYGHSWWMNKTFPCLCHSNICRYSNKYFNQKL